MEEINQIVPPAYQKWVIVGGLVLPYITRAIHALRTGGGLRGVWRGIWFGTNQPTEAQKEAQDERK